MAIRWAIGTACENDVVIIAGKGHEDFQEFYQEGEFVKVRIRRLKPGWDRLGTACEDGVVMTAGKGHGDFQELYLEGTFMKLFF